MSLGTDFELPKALALCDFQLKAKILQDFELPFGHEKTEIRHFAAVHVQG